MANGEVCFLYTTVLAPVASPQQRLGVERARARTFAGQLFTRMQFRGGPIASLVCMSRATWFILCPVRQLWFGVERGNFMFSLAAIARLFGGSDDRKCGAERVILVVRARGALLI